MKNTILGQMRCPKCGRTRPTIPHKCMRGYDPAIPVTQRIYKYPLSPQAQQKLKLPKGSVLLPFVTVQNGTPCLYARVDADETNTYELEVGILGTGWDIPDLPIYLQTNYFGSATDGEFVWHIYVRK